MADVTCVVHAHSLHSDGTGTVAEMARAARQAGAEVLLLTDHDTLAARDAGEHGYLDGVLVGVGLEVSPAYGTHLLAFGVDAPVEHWGRDAPELVHAVVGAGGLAFAAHPGSRGLGPLAVEGMPWPTVDVPGLTGVEVWNLFSDGAEEAGSIAGILRMLARPQRHVVAPPARVLAAFDAVAARRHLVALGGVDAHQVGRRRASGRVWPRAMSYARAFAQLRTHLLLDAPLSGDAETDLAAVLGALGTGRAYVARDALADATGFDVRAGELGGLGDELAYAPQLELTVRAPRAAELVLLADGVPVARAHGRELRHRPAKPAAYRAEAHLTGRDGVRRAWVLANPVFLR